jgi:acetyltransferase-like isoleucine patch superfamily enzyme
MAAVARLLLPEDFGLIAMITVFTGFAAILVDFGLAAARQRPTLEERHRSAAFWMNIVQRSIHSPTASPAGHPGQGLSACARRRVGIPMPRTSGDLADDFKYFRSHKAAVPSHCGTITACSRFDLIRLPSSTVTSSARRRLARSSRSSSRAETTSSTRSPVTSAAALTPRPVLRPQAPADPPVAGRCRIGEPSASLPRIAYDDSLDDQAHRAPPAERAGAGRSPSFRLCSGRASSISRAACRGVPTTGDGPAASKAAPDQLTRSQPAAVSEPRAPAKVPSGAQGSRYILLAVGSRVRLRTRFGTVLQTKYAAFQRVKCQLLYARGGIEAINRLLLTSTAPRPILCQFGARIEPGTIHGPLVIHNAARDYSNLRIGRRVHLGRDVLLDLSAPLTIEDEATVSMRATILTHQDLGDRPLSKRYPRKVEATTIGTGAYVGAGAVILCGCNVGEKAVVGAGAVVIRRVSAKDVVVGVPARSVA